MHSLPCLQSLESHSQCHPLCQCERCLSAEGPSEPRVLATADELVRCPLPSCLNCSLRPACSPPQGRTPLDYAVMLGRSEIVSLLLELGAPVESQTDLGQTALHKACQYGLLDIAKVGLATVS